MKRHSLAVVALVLATGQLGAQSIPPIARTKLAATHAVNQTNAHTSAMTNVSDSIPAQQRKGTPSTAKPASRKSKPDSVPVRQVESSAGSTASVANAHTFEREIYSYERNGRRDPFENLMQSSELRPLISDIKLVGVAFDASGRNSVAVLRDLNSKDQYRVRVGQSLGRLRVAAINPKFVTFTIEEFGFSRQETLALGDSNTGSSK